MKNKFNVLQTPIFRILYKTFITNVPQFNSSITVAQIANAHFYCLYCTTIISQDEKSTSYPVIRIYCKFQHVCFTSFTRSLQNNFLFVNITKLYFYFCLLLLSLSFYFTFTFFFFVKSFF